MGKALYRKYRSKNFDEVIGQEHVTETLKNALEKGLISHAYLFTGPKGVGKTSVARILAHAVNDLDYNDESIHLDIIEIDAASNRRIDEIRDLRDKVFIAPASGKYKVYIIDEVHMLTREAFNALLKTLEEPPEHAIFILATTEAHKVPDTIISRSQRFTFKPISHERTINHLRTIAEYEKLEVSEEALDLIATHGRGSFRDSISMLDQLAGLAKDRIELQDVQLLLGIPASVLIDSAVEAVSRNDIQSVFETVQLMKEQGVDSGQAAGSLSRRLREQLIENRSELTHEKILSLLKSLLPLTLTSSDFSGLELALLENMQMDARTERRPVRDMPQKNLQNKKTESSKKEISEEPPQNSKPKPDRQDTAFSTERWRNLLDELKKQYNTLYGVLRMSQASEENGQLVLTFDFGFHKKQVDAPRNLTVLRDFSLRHFGISDITTKLGAKQVKTSTPPPQKTDDPDVIASVSNIFGGAELLES